MPIVSRACKVRHTEPDPTLVCQQSLSFQRFSQLSLDILILSYNTPQLAFSSYFVKVRIRVQAVSSWEQMLSALAVRQKGILRFLSM